MNSTFAKCLFRRPTASEADGPLPAQFLTFTRSSADDWFRVRYFVKQRTGTGWKGDCLLLET